MLQPRGFFWSLRPGGGLKVRSGQWWAEFRVWGSGCTVQSTQSNYDPVFQERFTIGALIIRIGFWGPLYYNYNKEPQNSIGNY